MAATLDKNGREILDESPVEYPLHFRGGSDIPLHVRIRNIILQQMAQDNEGVETFEDADDFDVEDDPVDYTTPYEEHFDHMQDTASAPTREELQARLKELQNALAAKEKEAEQQASAPPEETAK